MTNYMTKKAKQYIGTTEKIINSVRSDKIRNDYSSNK